LEIVGYIGAVLIGLTLGLLGGGGSILTVPILVYLFGVAPVMATAYSLFVVGVTSLVGTIQYHRRRLISYRTALVFGIPSVISVYFTRALILPAIPELIFETDGFSLSRDVFIMSLFALLMLVAAISMMRKKGDQVPTSQPPQVTLFNYWRIILEGVLVGLLTGLVGAGGGFLIIPALVIFSKLDMKLAVGTSLLIISAKSLVGFTGDLSNYEVEWNFLGIFSLLAVGGIFVGNALSKKISTSQLKSIFGLFLLFMGAYILINELILNQ